MSNLAIERFLGLSGYAKPDPDSDDSSSEGSPAEDEHETPLPTRWNPKEEYVHLTRMQPSVMDRHTMVRYASSSKHEKQNYRLWRTRVARTTESRVICWRGIAPNESRLKSGSGKCYVCKLELQMDPNNMKSFPFAVWAKAAEKGCLNCQQIVAGTKLAAEQFEIDVKVLQLATVGADEIEGRGYCRSCKNNMVQHFSIALFWVDGTGDHSEHLHFSRTNEGGHEGQSLCARKVKDEAKKVGEWASADQYGQARKLLEMCNRDHFCHRDERTYQPTRLLEVRGTDAEPIVRVVKSDSLAEETAIDYIALSYCWGSKLPLRLLRSTVEDMESGIPWQDLPRLFQDSIRFARSINIRYLWVDALCIVQDDRSDWEREAAQMGNIYYHSYCTLGATSSRNSTDPLAMPSFQHIPIQKGIQGERYDEVEVSTLGGDLTWTLHHRGWGYQEILLPQRYLDFDSNGLNLHCCNGTSSLHNSKSQCGAEDEDYYRKWGNHQHKQDFRQPWAFRWFWTRMLEGNKRDGKNREVKMWQVWREVVMMYTNRRLTFLSDKLPALGGLAAEYQRLADEGETYYAGLWKNSFIELLTWRVTFLEEEPLETYTAPSWSWASVNGIVAYDQNYSYNKIKNVYVKVKEIILAHKGSNPYGELKSGYVVLEGLLSWCSLTKDQYSSGNNKYQLAGLDGVDIHTDFEADMPLENVDIKRGDGEVMRSARRVTALEPSSKAELEDCAVVLVHLHDYGNYRSDRVYLVLGVVDTTDSMLVLQRLGMVECYWFGGNCETSGEGGGVFTDTVKII